MTRSLFWIALAGGIGTLCRYSLHQFVSHHTKSQTFPWGTLAVNLVGCFLIGLVYAAIEHHFAKNPEFAFNPNLRAAIFIGFMGAFTTYSTYAFDTVVLLRDGHYPTAFAYILAHTFIGLAALFLGLMLGKAV